VVVDDDSLEEVEEPGAKMTPYAAAPTTANMMITITTKDNRPIAFLFCMFHGLGAVY